MKSDIYHPEPDEVDVASPVVKETRWKRAAGAFSRAGRSGTSSRIGIEPEMSEEDRKAKVAEKFTSSFKAPSQLLRTASTVGSSPGNPSPNPRFQRVHAGGDVAAQQPRS